MFLPFRLLKHLVFYQLEFLFVLGHLILLGIFFDEYLIFVTFLHDELCFCLLQLLLRFYLS
jgi:hypothetical protein